MSNKNKLVPKLRFPVFLDQGTWELCLLGEKSEIVRGGSPRPIQDFLTTDINGLNWLKIGDIASDSKYITKTTEKVISDALYKTREVFPGDLILSNSMSFGRPYILKIRTCIHDGWIAIRRISNDTECDFLYYIILSENSQTYFEANAAGAAVKNLNAEIIKALPITLPRKEEQQKIAACLSSLDDVITTETQKLKTLQAHKKALLQNLFPAEGETVPKLRFKEFEGSEEWEETTLNLVAGYENGKAHEQDITETGEFVVVNSKFISSDGEVRKFTNTAFCPAQKGDILMVLSDVPNGKAIAKCFLVHEDHSYTVNQRICRITPQNLNSRILYYLLNRNPYFLAFDDGVKQTNLRKEDVLNCPLLIPRDLKEQAKIADILFLADTLISAQSQKIESLKLHKKGLMQGLFPNTTEINNEH